MSEIKHSYFSYYHNKNITVKFVEANWFWKLFFKVSGFGAITLPNRRVVMLKEYLYNKVIIKHEMAHVEQYERMGTVKFLVSYFLLMVRYGYEKHPYEIEARLKSTK